MATKTKGRAGRSSSTADLKRTVDRKRLELELALLESAWEVPETATFRDELVDPETGEEWAPLGVDDKTSTPFRNERELMATRDHARRHDAENPYAQNLLNSIESFVVGPGHRYTVVPRREIKDADVAVEVAPRVQRFIDRLVKINRWRRRQRNAVRRLHRDGEVFIRLFPQKDGTTLFRFVEPADVHTPSSQGHVKEATFGVLTDPDDVESVEAYFVNDERVPAYEVQHRKVNVDVNCKRGLSSLYSVRAHLDRAMKLLRNMSQTVQNQSAIAMIRKHKAAPKGSVQSFADQLATVTKSDRVSGQSTRYQRIKPGTVLDVRDSVDYEFPSTGLDPAGPVEVLAAELRAIASSKSLPEYMIGSDASNANYASTMVSESPAVKFFETEQASLVEDDLDLLRAAIEHAVNVDRLPPEALTHVEIVAQPPKLISRDPKLQAETDEILMRGRVKSPQTSSAEWGLDYRQEQDNWAEHDDTSPDSGDVLSGPDPDAVSPGDRAADVQATGLNGAQIDGLLKIAESIRSGALPLFAAIAAVRISFPALSAEVVRQFAESIKEGTAA